MSRVEKLPDEPIIVITESGFINLEYINESMRQMDELAKTFEGDFHLLIDARQSDSNFVNVMAILSNSAPPEDARQPLTTTFVGKSSFLKLFRDAFSQKQFSGEQMALFENKQIALESIRLTIQRKQMIK